MLIHHTFGTLVSGLSIIVTAAAFAQQQPRQPAVQPQRNAATQPANPNARPNQANDNRTGQADQNQRADRVLSGCVAIANQKEVTLAQFAKDKAQHEDVKAFADMLVKDHSAFLEKLAKFTPEAKNNSLKEGAGRSQDATASTRNSGVQNAAGTSDADPAIRQTAGEQPTAAGSTRPMRGQGLDLIAIDREVAQKCIESAKQELSDKQGEKFDHCFMGLQIAAHAAMKDKLAVYQNHVSAELREVLAEGEQTTSQHLEKAKQIMEQLADAKKSEKSNSSQRGQKDSNRE